MDRTEMKLQNHDATLKSLETQVGQISQILNTRPLGGFPSDTEVAKGATHEQCKDITTRSGRVLEPTANQRGIAASPSAATEVPAEAEEDHQDPPNAHTGESSAESSHTKSNKLEEIKPPHHFHKGPHQPAFSGSIAADAKLLKDMVSRKKRIKEFETTAATETCLALMHNKVPAKKSDPGSFTIECFIGHNYPTKALCDPGASINLMPKSVFQKLGIGEAKPTTVMLQLADHSFVQPEGKIRDILVQVDKFIFPADFLILDCEADKNAPIILGRPFLSTSRSMIDFDKDEIVFKVDYDQVKMKALTKQLEQKNKGKGIDTTPTKGTQRLKPYVGAHIERDKANKLSSPKRHCLECSRQKPKDHQPPTSVAGGKAVEYLCKEKSDAHLPQPDSRSHKAGADQRNHHRLQVQRGRSSSQGAICCPSKRQSTFPCLISALCRCAAVPAQPADKYTKEKAGWTHKEYMRKMEVEDTVPIQMEMPTPPVSEQPEPVAPAGRSPSPVATPPADHATSPAPTSAATLATQDSRQSTPASPIGSTPTPPPSPPPVQSEKAAPIHILQLRSQLQRIEARQLQQMEETKVFQTSLINFLCFQFPSAVAFFSTPPTAEQPAPATAQLTPPADPSEGASNTEQLNLSTEDIFDWHTPMEHQSQLKEADILGSSKANEDAPAPTEPLAAKENTPRHIGKTLAKRIVLSDRSSSPEQPEQQPDKRQRRYHAISTDSDDESSAGLPAANPEQMQRRSIWIISYGKKRKELHFKEYMIQGFCENQVTLTKDPESTQAENSSTCRDTYIGRQGKYNRECDMISIFFQTPLDQERVKPRLKTISRADPKPKHTKSTWSTSLSREKSCFIKITLLYDF
ncbi:hypothetical protein V6N13_059659 [Hibiscus sabdariffa]